MIKKFIIDLILLQSILTMADWGYPEIDDAVVLNS